MSLNPCLDALLVEVAQPHQIAALSHYSRDARSSSMDVERAREFAVTGGTAEEVIALDPDLVLAGTFIAPTMQAALERAGIRVETFGSPNSVDESIAQLRRLAGLVGHPDQAQRLSDSIVKRFWLPTSEAQSDPSALLWQAGEIVPGERALITQLIEDSGFTNHAAALGLAQADRISLEQVLADPPDVLLVSGESQGQAHPLLSTVTGMHVAYLDPRLFYCAGPSIPEARRALAKLRQTFELERPAP
ncbi:MAG: ABC transporter substrate-binding protein [Pseudomonadota bacterium]